MYALINYGWAFHITYLPSYLEDRFELARDDLLGAAYKGAPLWFGAVGCLLGGKVVHALSRRSENRGRGRQVLGVAALTLCGGCWLAARNTPNVHLFCLWMALSGFLIDLTLGACWATCQDLGRRHTAVAAACMNTIGTCGAALAGWMTGTLVQRSVTQQAAVHHVPVPELSPTLTRLAVMDGYQFVFLTFFLVYLVAAACWLLIDPRQTIEPSHP
jgi:MFS transporter, ACS family, glucarate transporter